MCGLVTGMVDILEKEPLTFDISGKYFDVKFKQVATKDCIDRFFATIDEQEKRITELESKVAVISAHLEQLKRHNEDLEQYQQRLCLRINRIPIESGRRKTAEESMEKVRAVSSEIGVDIPDAVIDRAHRIRNVKVLQGKSFVQINVKFTT